MGCGQSTIEDQRGIEASQDNLPSELEVNSVGSIEPHDLMYVSKWVRGVIFNKVLIDPRSREPHAFDGNELPWNIICQ